MPTGTVKWFNNAKGYGFILPDQGGEDLFVHYSSIQMDGYKTLKAGQEVLFDVIQGDKGLHATNIQLSVPKKGGPQGPQPQDKGPGKKSSPESNSPEKREGSNRKPSSSGISKLETVP